MQGVNFHGLPIRPGMAAVGRVAFTRGGSSFKSLAFIGGGLVTWERKAGSMAAGYD